MVDVGDYSHIFRTEVLVLGLTDLFLVSYDLLNLGRRLVTWHLYSTYFEISGCQHGLMSFMHYAILVLEYFCCEFSYCTRLMVSD